MLDSSITTAFIFGLIWSGIGAMVIFVIFNIANSPVQKAEGMEFLNPTWLLKTYNINVFGAFLIAVCLAVLCPPASILYYLYKLCTIKIKRKSSKSGAEEK